MKYIIPSTLCLVLAATGGWYMVHNRVAAEVDETMLHVVIMRVPNKKSCDGVHNE